MKRALSSIAFLVWVPFAASLLAFTIVELAPGIFQYTPLTAIRYYDLRTWSQPDEVLVFVKSRWGRESETVEYGNLYHPRFGVDVSPVRHTRSYTELGFRANSSGPPWDVLFIGDSYIDFGERSDLTLSEMVHRRSGLATYNMGRSWYGPPQYVELLRRYGGQIRPRYAVLCWYDGNDLEDIRQYELWRDTGRYYSFPESNVVRRYVMAMRDTFHFVRGRARSVLDGRGVAEYRAELGGRPHPDIALVGEQRIAMRFGYREHEVTQPPDLSEASWRRAGLRLKEFVDIAAAQHIQPVVLFIPNQVEIHGPHVAPDSGERVRRHIAANAEFAGISVQRMRALTQQLGVPLIDLYPVFTEHAAHGEILYYPFDTHWNVRGREVAADAITRWFALHQRTASETARISPAGH